MSIQGNINNSIGQIATLASLSSIDKSIKELGFNTASDLQKAIRDVDLEIAKAKDNNKPYTALEELKNKYIELYKNYEKAKKEEEKKRKDNVEWLFICIFICIGLGLLMFMISYH